MGRRNKDYIRNFNVEICLKSSTLSAEKEMDEYH
jgi:hypothetical protein